MMKTYRAKEIEWLSGETSINGAPARFCTCPNAHLHTTPTQRTDCAVYLNTGRMHCLHGHCGVLGYVAEYRAKARGTKRASIDKVIQGRLALDAMILGQKIVCGPKPKEKRIVLRDIVPDTDWLNANLPKCGEWAEKEIHFPWDVALMYSLFPKNEKHFVTAFFSACIPFKGVLPMEGACIAYRDGTRTPAKGAWYSEPERGWVKKDAEGNIVTVDKNDIAGWFSCAVLKTLEPVNENGEAVRIRKDDNALYTRGLVLESDGDNALWNRFIQLMMDNGFPIAMVTHSGKRGNHAILRLPDLSKEEFSRIINHDVKAMFARYGADPAALTFGRLTRLPNVMRQNTGANQSLRFITYHQKTTIEGLEKNILFLKKYLERR